MIAVMRVVDSKTLEYRKMYIARADYILKSNLKLLKTVHYDADKIPSSLTQV